MLGKKREVRMGYAVIATILGLLVSLVDPIGRQFHVPEATTSLVKGLLLACSVLMVMLAVRHFKRSTRP